MKELKRGEMLIFTDQYDLFGEDMMGKEVMYYKTTTENKHMVLCLKSGEWAEVSVDMLEQRKPGYVPRTNKELCKRIKTLTITY